MTSFFSAEGGPIWIKFRRLVQNVMSTAMIWSKSKPDVEFQYGGRFGEFHGISTQSQVSHCRVLPLGEFTVMIPVPHAALQGAVTWRNQCHDRATLHSVIISSAILKIVFRHILFFWVFKIQFGFWLEAAFASSPIHLFHTRFRERDPPPLLHRSVASVFLVCPIYFCQRRSLNGDHSGHRHTCPSCQSSSAGVKPTMSSGAVWYASD